MSSTGIYLEDSMTGESSLLGEIEKEASIGTSDTADIQLDDIRCGGIHALIIQEDIFIVVTVPNGIIKLSC